MKLEPTSFVTGFIPIAIGRTENTRLKLWDLAIYTIRHQCSMSDSLSAARRETPASGLEDRHTAINPFAALAVRMRIELIVIDRSAWGGFAIAPTNLVIRPASGGISRMKILRPHSQTNRSNVDSKRIELFQKHCKCFSPAMEHDPPMLYGKPRFNRGSLFIPGEGSDQSEYSYIFFKELF